MTDKINFSIGSFSMISKTEEEQLHQFGEGPKTAYPGDKTIVDLFRDQVHKTPEATAVVFEGKKLTYRELDIQTDRLARHIQNNYSIKPGDIAGLLLDRSELIIIGILGILKSGAAYLPVDPSSPGERRNYMLKDAASRLLLTESDYMFDLEGYTGSVMVLDIELNDLSSDVESPADLCSPEDLAYVMYTSGSTGTPKGVMIAHRSVTTLVKNTNYADIKAEDRILQLSNYAFDGSVFDIFGALLNGASLYLIQEEQVRSAEDLVAFIKEHRINITFITTALFNVLVEINPGSIAQFDKIYFGGEKVSIAHARKALDYGKSEGSIVNIYGPTEATTFSLFYVIKDIGPLDETVPIGIPLTNSDVYILDDKKQLVPIGVPGELYLGGTGIARGYLNNPELTGEKFVAHPFKKGEKLYKTGDLAQWRHDGNVEFLSRKDDQLKIRGHRIEPAEIAYRLKQHQSVKDAVVIGKKIHENTELVAYIIAAGESTDKETLRKHLLQTLPEYMAPAYWVPVETFPLTPNGKIDKNALPEPSAANIPTGVPYKAPSTATEEHMAHIWEEVLGLERIGVKDNFFVIGGDSIKAIRLVSKINKKLDTALGVKDIFLHGDIESVAGLIAHTPEQQDSEVLAESAQKIADLKTSICSDTSLAGLLPEDWEDLYPMSAIEKGMIFHNLKDPQAGIYQDQLYHQFEEPGFDYELFKQAYGLMIEKHNIFRTSFYMDTFSEPVQVVHHYDPGQADIAWEDLSHLKPASQKTYLEDYMLNERDTPFILDKPGLCKMRVFKLGKSETGLLWIFHHAILDGWSNASFTTELFQVYTTLKQDPDYRPTPLKISYKNYITDQLRHSSSTATQAFWEENLQGYKRTPLPYYTENAVLHKSKQAAKHNQIIDDELAEKIGALAIANQLSIKLVFLSAFCYLIRFLTDSEDIVTGLVTNGRPEVEDGDKVLGCFLNTVPFRVSIPQKPNPEALLHIIGDKIKTIKPFEKLAFLEIAKLAGEQTMGENPVFDMMFNYIDFHAYRGVVEKAVISTPLIENYENTNTLFDFNVGKSALNGRYYLNISYARALYHPKQVQKIAAYYIRLLDYMATGTQSPISKEKITGHKEALQIKRYSEGAQTAYPGQKTVVDLFREQVAKTPDATAVIFHEAKLSYKQLDRISDNIAAIITSKLEIGKDHIIALNLNRSHRMISAIMAVLKAGAAYMPIDPDLPAARKEYLLENSSPLCMISENDSTPDIPHDIPMLYLSDDLKTIQYKTANATETIHLENIKAGRDKTSPECRITPDDLAYVIYTSGSTGNPKGVMIEHRGLLNRIQWMWKHYQFNTSDVILQKTPYSFDVSVWELLMSAAYGVTQIACRKAVIYDPEALAEHIHTYNVSTIHFVPSMYKAFLDVVTDNQKLISIKRVFTSGEALDRESVLKHYTLFGKEVPLHNLYGPTEASVDVSYYLTKTEDITVPIGKPIENMELYILDNDHNMQPEGVPGELCIAGTGVARGYLNNPKLTGEKFVVHPFKKGKKLYKTGDLARWRHDGNIEFLGRKDDQLKIRGHRIEPGEIAYRLKQHQSVKDAVVIGKKIHENTELVAYIIASRETLDKKTLRNHLLQTLPEYMAPAYWVPVEAFPLTSNGKLNKKALPEPLAPNIATGVPYVAPSTALEKDLIHIWQEVLGAEKIGVKDNFFAIGGDSIKAIRLVSKINKKLDAGLGVKDIFLYSDIEAMAGSFSGISGRQDIAVSLAEITKEIDELKTNILSDTSLASALPEDWEDVYPMSAIEKGMIFHNLKDSEAGIYQDQVYYQFEEPGFDYELFKQAYGLIVEKHEIFRTGFYIDVFPEPVQVVHRYDPGQADIVREDLSHLPTGSQKAYLEDYIIKERTTPFILNRPGLCRMRIFKLGEAETGLLWIFHHAILDGWSNASFTAELFRIYMHLKQDVTYKPVSLGISYKDYVIDQLRYSRSADTKAFWKKELYGYQRTPPPYHTKDPARHKSKKVAKYTRILDKKLSDGLMAFTRSRQLGIKDAFLAAFCYVIHLVTNREDIVIGLVTNGRPDVEDGDKILGCFLNTIPLRVNIPVQSSPAGLTHMISDNIKKIKPFEKLSFMEIAKLSGDPSPGQNPVFDIMFNYIDFHAYEDVARETVLKEPLIRSYENTNTLFDFNLGRSVVNDNYYIHISYAEALYSEAQIHTIAEFYIRLLDYMTTHPQVAIAREKILGETIVNTLINEFNDTEVIYPEATTVAALFRQQAEKTPEVTAVVFEDKKLTYRQLNDASDKLAHVLLNQVQAGRDKTVALLLPRSERMIIAILGVLKSGAAYVPVAPGYPAERKQYMLKDSNPVCVICEKETAEDIPDAPVQILLPKAMEEITFKTNGKSEKLALNAIRIPASGYPVQGAIVPDDLAYIIYTSGSTGSPKGVQQTHRTLFNLNQWQSNDVSRDRAAMLQFTSFSFDVSIQDICYALLNGHSLHICSEALKTDWNSLHDYILAHGIQIISLPTSALNALFSIHPYHSVPCPLSDIFTYGEKLTITSFLHEFLNRHPGIKLHNHYGPTETHVVSSFTLSGAESALSLSPPIGKPINRTSIYILNTFLELVPVGVPGELCVSGDNLARGYLNNERLTQEKFVEHPFKQGEKLYKTGDLAYWLPDGNIVFIGRQDNQLKVRGYRVEPGEIAYRLKKHKNVKDSVVTGKDIHGTTELIAYIIPQEKDMDVADLSAHLQESLPVYMIPSYWVALDAFPLSPNGKLDEKALPKPKRLALSTREYAMPQNDTQKTLIKIWEEVLGYEHPGIYDNFFESGGHSIRSINLVSKINRAFEGNHLQIADIFNHPTIDALAGVIHQRAVGLNPVEKRNPHIIPLREGENKVINFIIPGMPGISDGYYEMAAKIPGDNAVYGLQMKGITGEKPLESIEEMAAHNVALIQQIKQEGRINIYAHSYGGTVVYEMLKQLGTTALKADKIVFIDAMPTVKRRHTDKQTVLIFCHTLFAYAGIAPEETRDMIRAITARPKKQWKALILEFIHKYDNIEASFFGPLWNVLEASMKVTYNHDQKLPYTVQLVIAEGNPEPLKPVVWDKYFENVRVVYARGDHFSVVREPDCSQWLPSVNGKESRKPS